MRGNVDIIFEKRIRKVSNLRTKKNKAITGAYSDHYNAPTMLYDI